MIEINAKITNVELINQQDSDKTEKLEQKLIRPKKLKASVYRIKPPSAAHALYVTIADIKHQGKTYPYEIFFNTQDPVHTMWTNTLTLLLSALFRQHIENKVDISPIIEKLSHVPDLEGGYWAEQGNKKSFLPSVVAEIGEVVKAHLIKTDDKIYSTCPECKNKTLIKSSGCDTCTTCGYSKC